MAASLFVRSAYLNRLSTNEAGVASSDAGFATNDCTIISTDCTALKIVWKATHGHRFPVFIRIIERIRLRINSRPIVAGLPRYWGTCTIAKSKVVTITASHGVIDL